MCLSRQTWERPILSNTDVEKILSYIMRKMTTKIAEMLVRIPAIKRSWVDDLKNGDIHVIHKVYIILKYFLLLGVICSIVDNNS